MTVNAVDANFNVVSNTDTVSITSSDTSATLPANAALAGGTKQFSVTFKTATGSGWTVTATCVSGAPTLTADTGTATLVNAGTATQLQVLMPGRDSGTGQYYGQDGTPTTHSKGAAFNVTVNAVDANFNVVSNRSDTVKITSSDASATLPGNAALVGGTKTFSVTFNTATGSGWTVTATYVSGAPTPDSQHGNGDTGRCDNNPARKRYNRNHHRNESDYN